MACWQGHEGEHWYGNTAHVSVLFLIEVLSSQGNVGCTPIRVYRSSQDQENLYSVDLPNQLAL